MKNEDKIIELLSEMLIRQDRFESSLEKIVNSQERLVAIQERQEKILINILEVLADESSMN